MQIENFDNRKIKMERVAWNKGLKGKEFLKHYPNGIGRRGRKRILQRQPARNWEIKIKLGKEEKRILQQKADALSLKLSTYVRMCSLNAKIDF